MSSYKLTCTASAYGSVKSSSYASGSFNKNYLTGYALPAGKDSSSNYYKASITFPAISSNWIISSMTLYLYRYDTNSAHTLYIGTRSTNTFTGTSEVYDEAKTISLAKNKAWRSFDITSWANTIQGYEESWYLHIWHGSGSNSYSTVEGYGSSTYRPYIQIEYTEQATQYTVTYDLNGGTTTSSQITFTVDEGSSTPTINNPTKASDDTYTYTFSGWSPSISNTVTANITYVAQWTSTYRNYTITYNLNGGTSSETLTYSKHYGDATPTINNPTKASDNTYIYTFNGWSPSISSTVSGNATYTAQWTSSYRVYAISYSLDGGTSSETTIYYKHYGDTTPTISNPYKRGYTFTKWNPSISSTVTGSKTYTAIWTENDYGIIINNIKEQAAVYVYSNGEWHRADVNYRKDNNWK